MSCIGAESKTRDQPLTLTFVHLLEEPVAALQRNAKDGKPWTHMALVGRRFVMSWRQRFHEN